MTYPFFVNHFDRLKNYGDQEPAKKIFLHPVSFWLTKNRSAKQIKSQVSRILQKALPCLPIFVIYNLPGRDLGQHSRGGLESSQYLEFINAVADAIGDSSPIVIFEPDALPHMLELDDELQQKRLLLIREALTVFTTKSAAQVYLDIGHPAWLSAAQAASILEQVYFNEVRGFSVNVSNFQTTNDCLKWGEIICQLCSYNHFVIDTSRNGAGPLDDHWCNPPNRAIGFSPTTNTNHPNCDAFLWVKIPGESDGKCCGGPSAGTFWLDYANQLVENSWLSKNTTTDKYT